MLTEFDSILCLPSIPIGSELQIEVKLWGHICRSSKLPHLLVSLIFFSKDQIQLSKTALLGFHSLI